MATSSVRVLVADDFEPFRRFVESVIREDGTLRIVGEVADGLEVVQKADELQPELILLDIGLPRLNGIEAARRIRALCPKCKILFVSQETSVDVVRAALSTGARGYVVKTDAGSELLIAILSVLRGEQFVGARYANHSLLPPSPAAQKARIRQHEVLFYSDRVIFLDRVAQFVGSALISGDAVVVVATEQHRDGVLARLQASGADTHAAMNQGRYVALDADDTLLAVMVNDRPEPVRFAKCVGDCLTAAAQSVNRRRPRVAAYGECAPVLCGQGNDEAAIRIEQLWNDLGTTYDLDVACDVDLLCGYPSARFYDEERSPMRQRICAEHTVCRGPETGVAPALSPLDP